jgi:hypothetical protein
VFEAYSNDRKWTWVSKILNSKQRWRGIAVVLLILFTIVGWSVLFIAPFAESELILDAVLPLLIASSISIMVAHYLYRSWQRAQEPTGEQQLAGDMRRPILYLRPFKFEKVGFYARSTTDSMASSVPAEFLHRIYGRRSGGTAEQFFVGLLQTLGPVVAIGRPGEKIPPLGAARLYPGDDWQGLFVKLLDRAQMVILFAGTSENFRWEMEQVFRRSPFVPTMLLMPYFRGLNSLWNIRKQQIRIDQFRALFHSVTAITLPDGLEYCRLIYFRDPHSPQVMFDSGEDTERRLNMLNPFLGPISRVMEGIYPGWTQPYISQSQHFDPDGGRGGKLEIAYGIFHIIMVMICLMALLVFLYGLLYLSLSRVGMQPV